MTRRFHSLPEERFYLLDRVDRQNRSLAIFVHGYQPLPIDLLGPHHLDVWGNLQALLLDHADSEEPFASWDYVFLGYKSGQISSYLDIARILASTWTRAAEGQKPFKRKYVRLALIGHSLGTLGIRQLLCATELHTNNFVKKLHTVTMFGSPLNGSWWARLTVTDIGKALLPNNAYIEMLRVWNNSMYAFNPWPTVTKVAGFGDWVAPSKDADRFDFKGDGPSLPTPRGHIDMKQLKQWDQPSFFKDVLENALANAKK